MSSDSNVEKHDLQHPIKKLEECVEIARVILSTFDKGVGNASKSNSFNEVANVKIVQYEKAIEILKLHSNDILE